MNRSIISALDSAQKNGATVVLATVIEVAGSTPRHAGARMLISDTHIWGTIGGGAIEQRVMTDARELLSDDHRETHTVDVHLVRELGMCCGGRMQVFLEKILPEPKLWIFGTSRVAQQVARLAQRSGFSVSLVTCGSSNIPIDATMTHTVLETDDALELIRETELTKTDYAVVMSRDHQLDFDITAQLLEKNPRFIGMIGSRTKWTRFETHMKNQGAEQNTISTVCCPVGLDIAALTPEEIAVSVVSQLIAVRRGGQRWSKS